MSKNIEKIALITGASSGIGKRLAIGLSEDGFKTILISSSIKKLNNVKNEIKKLLNLPKKMIPICISANLRNEDEIKKVFNYISRHKFNLDLIINSAGIGTSGSLELTSDQFNELVEVNLRGPFLIMKYLVPIMITQKNGYVINISSRNGKVAVAGLGAYSATKYGLVGLSESLYRELSQKGVKITTICPGWVNTRMAYDEGCTHKFDAIIQPEDILNTVRWLIKLPKQVSIMEVLLECTIDIEKRSTIQL